MRFGFHISISGGFSKVVPRAIAKRCVTIQFFSRNPRGWKHGEVDPEEAEALRAGLASARISPVFLHMPYLANLASPDQSVFNQSVASLAEELSRAPVLGAGSVITHVGRRLGSDEEPALERVARGIDAALSSVPGETLVLLETTSGMGSEVGYTFDQLSRILRGVAHKERVGVCLDTAHVFQAGYDLSSDRGLGETIARFDRDVGLPLLRLVHLNDSRTPCGSRVDRHWHIGKGRIGIDGMRRLLKHPALEGLPGIMETPRRSDREDLANLRTVERLTR